MKTPTPGPAGRILAARARLRHGVGNVLLAGVAYLAAAMVWTYPLVRQLDSAAVWDGNSDLTEKLWNLWWFRTALVDLHTSPFWTDRIYYPRGISLYLQPFNLPAATVGVVLQPLVGLVATYNLVVLASIALAGVTCYLLARQLVGGPGAFVAGLVYAFNWLHGAFLTAGTLELISLLWLPLVALALLHLLARRSLGSGVLLALAVSVTALASWYYALQAVVLVAVLLAGTGLADRATRARCRALVPPLGVATLATIALLAPVLIPTIRDARGLPNAVPDPRVITSYSAHLEDLLRLTAPVALLLALAGIVTAPRRALPWLAATAAFFLLALGPLLHLGDRVVGEVPLPYRLLQALPLADVGRFPVRFQIGAMLGVAVLAGLGVHELAGRATRLRPRLLLAGTLAAAVIASLALTLAPLPVSGLAVDPVYGILAGRTDGGAVLDYPLRDRMRSYQMYYATVHGHPVLGGIASRSSPHAFVDEGAWLKGFVFLTRAPVEDIVGRENGLRLLQAAGIRYLVLHRDLATAAERQRFQQLVDWYLAGQAPFYEDATVEAYEVPTADGLPGIEVAQPPGVSWYGVESQPGQPPWRWSGGSAAFRVISSQERDVILDLDLFSFGRPRRVEVLLNGSLLQTLPADELSQRPPAVALALRLHPGENWVTFVPDGPPVQPPGDERGLSLGFRSVRLESSGADLRGP